VTVCRYKQAPMLDATNSVHGRLIKTMLRLVVIIILEMMMITMQDKCDYNIIINTHTHTHTHSVVVSPTTETHRG